jgi:hypothetical protein
MPVLTRAQKRKQQQSRIDAHPLEPITKKPTKAPPATAEDVSTRGPATPMAQPAFSPIRHSGLSPKLRMLGLKKGIDVGAQIKVGMTSRATSLHASPLQTSRRPAGNLGTPRSPNRSPSPLEIASSMMPPPPLLSGSESSSVSSVGSPRYLCDEKRFWPGTRNSEAQGGFTKILDYAAPASRRAAFDLRVQVPQRRRSIGSAKDWHVVTPPLRSLSRSTSESASPSNASRLAWTSPFSDTGLPPPSPCTPQGRSPRRWRAMGSPGLLGGAKGQETLQICHKDGSFVRPAPRLQPEKRREKKRMRAVVDAFERETSADNLIRGRKPRGV